MQPNLKITGETQEVCSDKRKPIQDRKEREEIEKAKKKKTELRKHAKYDNLLVLIFGQSTQ